MRALLLGYGNPARGDDGLGPALVAGLDGRIQGLQCEADYQLAVEHAALLPACDLVIFADAAVGLDLPFRLAPLAPAPPLDLGSHALTPGAVYHLAFLLYGATPEAWVLAISGQVFGEIAEGLSPAATAHLAAARDALTAFLAARG